MLSLYQLFRIIFGLIIAGVVLVVIITFLGSYTQLQEDSQRAVIVKNFLTTAENVYLTGNGIGFDDFTAHDVLLSFDGSEPAGLISGTGKSPVRFTLLPSFGDSVFISRQELDMGWWSFRFAEAMPASRIIFNVVSPDWGTVRNIAAVLPDSEFFSPQVTFGLCDGTALQERLCTSGLCERQEFLAATTGLTTAHRACTVQLPPGSRLVTIAPSCTASRGICLTPPDAEGIGMLHLRGRPVGPYKDPVDVAAAIIGGEREDVFGTPGETLYHYKNEAFRREVGLAARILMNRALLIGQRHPPLPASGCQPAYQQLLTTMTALASLLDNPDYYKTPASAASLVALLRDARAGQSELVNKGCDYL